MDRTFKVVYDANNTLKSEIITSNELINLFLQTANDNEDAELIGWITTLLQTDKQEEAVEFVSDLWDIELEEQ